jgi:pimeloyl-ACP methyl ester carboxylesterase
MKFCAIFRSALLASALLWALPAGAQPDASWQHLPPTPSLPPGGVVSHIREHGARLWYSQWNSQGSLSPPVLLLHGGYGNSSYFGHLIAELTARHYRVVALDSRGHGRSSADDRQINFDLMASDVIGLLDHLHIRQVSIVGWSDGGCTGLDLAIHHPDRVARLFAFGAVADQSGLKQGFDKDPVFAAYLERAPKEYQALSPTPDRWTLFDANINRMWSMAVAFNEQQLRSIRVPTTIADGEHDEGIKPEHNRYLARTIIGAQLVILPNVGHFAMLQNPSEFNSAVLEFLKGP